MTFIQRNYDRTEHDDFMLNVEKHLEGHAAAFPAHDAEGNLVGWFIKASRWS
jgi:hypothetical protein